MAAPKASKKAAKKTTRKTARKPAAKKAKTTLSKKQVAQRKYAGAMAGIRKRATAAKGGKGPVAKRSAAVGLRRKLGLKSA